MRAEFLKGEVRKSCISFGDLTCVDCFADLAVALAGVLSKATLRGKEARVVVNVGGLHSEKL